MTAETLPSEVGSSDLDRKTIRKSLIRYYVWRSGPLSRGRLGEALDLNLPTISNCVAELLAEGEVVEEGYAESTGGRKAQLLDINSARGTVAGLAMTSRGISSASADLKGRLQNQRIYPLNIADGKNKVLAVLVRALREQFDFIASAGLAPVSQIGVGISGLVNSADGASRVFPRFDTWRDVPLREIFEREFRVPVVVDSHIAANALAECVFGRHRGFRNAIYVQLGPGLGAGVIIEGRIYRGSKDHVGEFGHTTVSENGPICYCGNYGCLESLAGDHALIQQAEAGIREGVQTRILEFASEPGRVTPGAVFRAAAAGDRFASNLVEKIAGLLGTGIANLVNLFGPELVILGGTMAEAGDLIINPICRTLEARVLDRMEKGVEIRASSFGNEESIKGAVTLALHSLLTRGLAPRDIAALN